MDITSTSSVVNRYMKKGELFWRVRTEETPSPCAKRSPSRK